MRLRRTNKINMKKILPLIIILLIAGIALVYSFVSDTNTTSPNVVVPEQTISEVIVVEWQSSVIQEDEFGTPTSVVSISIDGNMKEIASTVGTCSESGLELLENQISSYLCWWAGGGTEFGVFTEGDKLIIKKGIVEEGGADFEGFRGDFEVLEVAL